MQGCCPQNSWPKSDFISTGVGKINSIQGIPLYEVGKGEKSIVIITDIFGLQSGRHKTIADSFAQLGYRVFVPQILMTPYDGPITAAIVQNIKGQDFNAMIAKFQKIKAYLQKQGVKNFFCIGFCWGVWMAFKLAAKYEGFTAIAGCHPSINIEDWFGGSQNQMAQNVKCPAMFLPAGNDVPNIKNGGELVQILLKRFGGDKIQTHTFEQMQHGWIVRGDLTQQNVQRDANKALDLVQKYFNKF